MKKWKVVGRTNRPLPLHASGATEINGKNGSHRHVDTQTATMVATHRYTGRKLIRPSNNNNNNNIIQYTDIQTES
jgi:hypothetical protein